MIQTTKDADKAKTSQRQRVDDQKNDRFVSRNCHHDAPTGRTILGAIHLFLQRFPGFAAGRTARDRKRTSSVQHRDLVTVFSYLTFLTRSIQLSSYRA